MTVRHARDCGSADSTSVSLIDRVRDCEPDAWRRMCQLYSPLVYHWACRGGLQHNDAADILQDVFQAVLVGLNHFQYDEQGGGSFRGWLWTITRNQVRQHFRRQARREQSLAQEVTADLAQPSAFFDQQDDPTDAGSRKALLRRALQLIRPDFSPAVWEAFEQTALLGQSAAETAARLNISENAVRQAKFRVLKRLRLEIGGDL